MISEQQQATVACSVRTALVPLAARHSRRLAGQALLLSASRSIRAHCCSALQDLTDCLLHR